jgi:hypothetical protein
MRLWLLQHSLGSYDDWDLETLGVYSSPANVADAIAFFGSLKYGPGKTRRQSAWNEFIYPVSDDVVKRPQDGYFITTTYDLDSNAGAILLRDTEGV